jgi:predicted nuclease of predicted toxin-antitoxin system
VAGYLIDANLPYRFSVWHGDDYRHAYDLGESWEDIDLWRYARDHDLTIVTKDTDFSDWILLSEPPPRVIHLRIGNMRIRDFHRFISDTWPNIIVLSATHKLVSVYPDRIECVE